MGDRDQALLQAVTEILREMAGHDVDHLTVELHSNNQEVALFAACVTPVEAEMLQKHLDDIAGNEKVH